MNVDVLGAGVERNIAGSVVFALALALASLDMGAKGAEMAGAVPGLDVGVEEPPNCEAA